MKIQKCEENNSIDNFKRLIQRNADESTWIWLRRGNLKRESVFFLKVNNAPIIRIRHKEQG